MNASIEYHTETNVRTDQIKSTINNYAKRGWAVEHLTSIRGDIGSTFTIVFRKQEPGK